MEYGVIQFQNLLDALIEPHDITQNVLTILALAATSTGLRTKVKAALKVVIKMTYDGLIQVTDAMKDGKLPSVSSEYDNEAFGDQIGIVQLASAKFDDQVKHVNAILKFIQKHACFIKDKDQKLKMARYNLEKFNPTQYDDCTVMIADYEELLRKCESWAEGPFELFYDSMQRLVSKCTECVHTEYFDKISENKVQELDVDFDGFKTQLTDAWDIANRKQKLKSGMNNRSQMRMSSLSPQMPFFDISNSRANNIARPTMPLKPDCDTNEFTDITIKCNFPGCDTDFVWSSGEQQFFKDKGYENAPKKCTGNTVLAIPDSIISET